MNKLFILSTGRTGSTFLYSLFKDVIEETISREEEKPAFKRRGFELTSRAPTTWERYYFKVSRDWRMVTHSGNWFVESNCRLFSASELIRSVYPDARIYHVVRDGRTCVRSWLNRGRYTDADTATRLTPDMYGTIDITDWKTFTPLQKNAWSWTVKNRNIQQGDPDEVFHFEDVFNEPHDDLFRLLDSLDGLQYREEQIHAKLNERVASTDSYLFPRFPDWYEEWKTQFWDIAEEQMRTHGYQ